MNFKINLLTQRWGSLVTALGLISLQPVFAATPVTLFEDHFTGGIPGWTAVQPAGGLYIDGPMLWVYDAVSDSYSEQSNLYTDGAGLSVTRIAPMLINDAVVPGDFAFTARLTAGDDDGFGLVWGYENENTFYRVSFARQARATGWPHQGVMVDRMNNGQITDIFGPDTTFINTAGRPFDVTIRVNGGNLTLTVVDDVLGSPLTYNVVTDLPLPYIPTAGKVGIFSWGMAGGNPRSFRVQNPVLSPTALAGDPAGTVLPNWSFLVTPRSDGVNTINSGGAEPLWGQGLSLDGDRGTMIQNSDSYNSTDNNASGTAHFIAPSAVAGDANWDNYLYRARFISSDNDGFGLLLRFQNELNFYRIAFRNQNSTSGVKRGISIQKAVNQVFEEIYSSTLFIPPTGVPIEVNALINGNRLQVLINSNPDSASSEGYFFGPFDITGGTVDKGKIGIFSWAQNNEPAQTTSDAGTEVDSVSVLQMAGEGLIVSSAYGNPTPAAGVHDFPSNSEITASVESPITTAPGVRQVCTGWTGMGAAPASGTANEVTFALASFSGLTWKWTTEYQLTTSASEGGTVTTTNGTWIVAGTEVLVTAVANPGYLFTGWSGSSLQSAPSQTFAMTKPMTLKANFAADSDTDGLPDAWETQYFGGLAENGAGDFDHDGVTNAEEYLRGSNPAFEEALIASDGLSSKWVNTGRDPALPGELHVTDFGSGYRGVFGDANEYRWATDATFVPADNLASQASFQTHRMIVRPSEWTESWASNFSASIDFTVGDNDGNCFYFRYVNESNWFRVTLCGENDGGQATRPLLGLSAQRRLDGIYSAVPIIPLFGPEFAAYTDPLDGGGNPAGFKKVRVTVSATNENFEVKVTPWDYNLDPDDFNAVYDLIATFSDTSLPSGRVGFGLWGQGSFGSSNAVNGIPIPTGAFVDNLSLRSPADGAVVFSENWNTAPLYNEIPAGWLNPYEGVVGLEGNWRVNVDGSLCQMANEGISTTGTLAEPKADADANILLAPVVSSANYLLVLGLHPFDNDGVGFVYDFKDTNNYSRVMFRQEATYDGAIPPGVSVTRKSGGVWSDIVVGDLSFRFIPGRPFEVQFGNNNGSYHLVVKDLDDPGTPLSWHWTGPAATVDNRFGVTTWFSPNAHFLYARAYGLPAVVTLEIGGIAVTDGNVVLSVSKPEGSRYDVLRATDLAGPYEAVATNQTANQYSEPQPPGTAFYRLRLVP